MTDSTEGRDPGGRGYWVQAAVRNDLPRYEPENLKRPYERPTCFAPMIRRVGVCGKSTTVMWTDRDPETGVGEYVGLCSRHRALEVNSRHRLTAWRDNGEPSPPPNRGGILPRYFKTDWAKLYGWAAPGRTPLEGAREAVPPRPTLRLIQGGVEGAAL